MTANTPSCPICFYDYDPTTFAPFIGICGHDVCAVCVRQIDRCPICMSGGSFAHKNKNFGMLTLISLLKENGGQQKERQAILEEKRRLNDEKANIQKEKEDLGEEKRILMQEKQRLNEAKNFFNMEKMAAENQKTDFEREKRTFAEEIRKLTAEKNALVYEKDIWNRSKKEIEEEKKNLGIEKENLNQEKRSLQEQKERFDKEKRENTQPKREQEMNTTKDAQMFVTSVEKLSSEMAYAMEDIRLMKRAIYSLNMGGVRPGRQELFKQDLQQRIAYVMDAAETIKACAAYTAIELTKVTSAVAMEMEETRHTDCSYA